LQSAIRARFSARGLRARVGIFGMQRAKLLAVAAAFKQRTGLTSRAAGRIASQLAKSPFYAVYVEFGTQKMPARPFLLPSFRQKRRAILAGIAAAARKAISKVT
jgi:HK97 gp10 family phage protein